MEGYQAKHKLFSHKWSLRGVCAPAQTPSAQPGATAWHPRICRPRCWETAAGHCPAEDGMPCGTQDIIVISEGKGAPLMAVPKGLP